MSIALVRRTLTLIACAGLAACGTDPTAPVARDAARDTRATVAAPQGGGMPWYQATTTSGGGGMPWY